MLDLCGDRSCPRYHHPPGVVDGSELAVMHKDLKRELLCTNLPGPKQLRPIIPKKLQLFRLPRRNVHAHDEEVDDIEGIDAQLQRVEVEKDTAAGFGLSSS